MSKVELPYAEPMFSTYHSLACAGIPAKQNSTSDIWYYNNMFEWHCDTRFLQGFTSPNMHMEVGIFINVDFLNVVAMDNRFARRCPIEIIETMLDDGYYVAFTNIDDFYIKGKSWYNEKHFRHDGLIIGYDDEKETFKIVAYNERWIFSVFETPQKGFEKGIRHFMAKTYSGALYALKAKNICHKLDIKIIREKLMSYLNSNTKNFPMATSNKIYGIILLDYICIYIDKLIDGSIPHERRDRRLLKLIWEHKKCMLNRIIAVENKYNLGNELSEKYSKLVELVDKARFIYAKFTVKFSARHLEKIQEILQEIKHQEVVLLNEFLTMLTNILEKEKI